MTEKSRIFLSAMHIGMVVEYAKSLTDWKMRDIMYGMTVELIRGLNGIKILLTM